MELETYFETLQDSHILLHSELTTELKSNSKTFTDFFKYNNNLKDPFQDINLDISKDTSVLNDLYNWYISINPEYKPLNDLKPVIPKWKDIQPYRTLLLGIAKDLIILKSTEKFPKPKILEMTNNDRRKLKEYNNAITAKPYNTEDISIEIFNLKRKYNRNNRMFKSKEINHPGKLRKVTVGKLQSGITTIHSRELSKLEKITPESINIINSLLKLINEVLSSYEYKEIINIIHQYLLLFSYGYGHEILKQSIKENGGSTESPHTDIFNTLHTPFLIYPTFNPISYTKVIYFMQAPVLNFIITNTRIQSHGRYIEPYLQITHDIAAHAKWTHSYEVIIEGSEIYVNEKLIIDRMLNQPKKSIPFNSFAKINNSIQSLKNYINYDRKIIDNIPNSDDKSILNNINIKKLILCYVLFCLFHESASHRGYGIGSLLLSFDNLVSQLKDIPQIISNENSPLSIDFIEVFPKLEIFKNKDVALNMNELAISYLNENKLKIEAERTTLNGFLEQKLNGGFKRILTKKTKYKTKYKTHKYKKINL